MPDSEIYSSKPLHPIGYVSRRSGLTTHIIRVWEKRYAAITPARTETNRRLYSDSDIERLSLLKNATSNGHSISSVATLTDEILRSLDRATGKFPTRRLESSDLENGEILPIPTTEVEIFLERCKAAVPRMNRHGLEAALREASVVLSAPFFLEQLAAPFMRWIGERWHAGEIQIAHERFASAAVRDVLYRFSSQDSEANLPKVIVCTPNGNFHEIGALLAAGAATLEGWNSVYLGANLPVSEIGRVALELHVYAVALSCTYMEDPRRLIANVEELQNLLPKSCPIFIGGEATIQNQTALENLGINFMHDLQSFRLGLRESLLESPKN